MGEICGHILSCAVWKTYSEHNNYCERVDLIAKYKNDYHCIAVEFLKQESSEDTAFGQAIKEDLKKISFEIDFNCSHITLLNKLEALNLPM